MTTEIKHHDDGETIITIHRMEKKIRAADGTFRTLVSYDGEHWALDPKRARVRFQRGVQLHKQLKKKALKRIHASDHIIQKEAPVLLPVAHHGEMRSRDRAKRPRKPKNFRNVNKVRPVHFHWCHGRQFACSCDHKYLRRLCGGDSCLVTGLRKETISQ